MSEYTSNLSKALAEIPDILFRELKVEVRIQLRKFDRLFVTRRLSGRPGLGVRTGFLRRSWNVEVFGSSLDTLRGIYFTNVPYAAIHEFGGIIKARPGKFLAIPLEAARTAAGVARGGPRSFQNTFISGNIIYQEQPNGDPIALFVLKKQVVIPARMGLRNEWQAYTPEIIRGFTKAADRALEKATRS